MIEVGDVMYSSNIELVGAVSPVQNLVSNECFQKEIFFISAISDRPQYRSFVFPFPTIVSIRNLLYIPVLAAELRSVVMMTFVWAL